MSGLQGVLAGAPFPGFGTGASTADGPDQVSGDGASSAAARADHTHNGQGSGTPSTQAFGDAAAAGSSGKWARSDHKHAMPHIERKNNLSFSGGTATWSFASAFAATPVVVGITGETAGTRLGALIYTSVSTTSVALETWHQSGASTTRDNPSVGTMVIAMDA